MLKAQKQFDVTIHKKNSYEFRIHKFFIESKLQFFCLKMHNFMLGNLQIRILKMLAMKSISTISLYEVLTKEGIKKIAFEHAITSLEKKKLICRESVLLLLAENGRKMLEILETADLSPTRINKIQRKSRTNCKFIGNLDATYHGKHSRFEIYEDGNRYRITSSRAKNPANYVVVNQNTVRKVFHHLKKDEKHFVSEIEEAIQLSSTTIHNALKVLRVQKKAGFEIDGKKRRFLYFAL